MDRPVHTVRPTDAVEHAARLLGNKKLTAAPVLNEADQVIWDGQRRRPATPPSTDRPTAHRHTKVNFVQYLPYGRRHLVGAHYSISLL